MSEPEKDRPKKLYLIDESTGSPQFSVLEYVEICDSYISQHKQVFTVHKSEKTGLTLYLQGEEQSASPFDLCAMMIGAGRFRTEKQGGITGVLKYQQPDLYREERAAVEAYLERMRAYGKKVDAAIDKLEKELEKSKENG